MSIPEWTKYVRVDQIIECYDVSKETSQALMVAMPAAYGGVEEVDLEDAWPEPDAARDEPYKLSKVWDRLAESVREDIVAAKAGEER